MKNDYIFDGIEDLFFDEDERGDEVLDSVFGDVGSSRSVFDEFVLFQQLDCLIIQDSDEDELGFLLVLRNIEEGDLVIDYVYNVVKLFDMWLDFDDEDDDDFDDNGLDVELVKEEMIDGEDLLRRFLNFCFGNCDSKLEGRVFKYNKVVRKLVGV